MVKSRKIPEKTENLVENAKKQVSGLPFEQRQKQFNDRFKQLQDACNMNVEVVMNFPEYRMLPVDLQLALEVLNKHKFQYIINPTDRRVA